MSFPDPAIFIPLIFAIGVFPIALVMVTCYTKIVVVLALLKSALGLQQVPPTIVTNGLALVLSWYVMYPVGMQAYEAIEAEQRQPRATQTLTTLEVLERVKPPLREFLDKHARPHERAFFMDAAGRLMGEKYGASMTDTDFVILVPSFVLSELTEAFLIGVIIALPFIVIDLLVANVLMALGMQMMSPTMLSLPIKVLLFVVLDGWSRLAHALILTYRQ
jgi:type III secretion protein R